MAHYRGPILNIDDKQTFERKYTYEEINELSQLPPIRCFQCGRMLHSRYHKFFEALNDNIQKTRLYVDPMYRKALERFIESENKIHYQEAQTYLKELVEFIDTGAESESEKLEQLKSEDFLNEYANAYDVTRKIIYDYLRLIPSLDSLDDVRKLLKKGILELDTLKPKVWEPPYTKFSYNHDIKAIYDLGKVFIGKLNDASFKEMNVDTPCCRIIIADIVRRGLLGEDFPPLDAELGYSPVE